MKRNVIVAVVAGMAIFMILSVFINDYSAQKVSTRLEGLPLPESTEYIESVSKAGKLNGNGNGMQYFGAILIRSELSREELDAFYEEYRKNEWDCQVADQSTQEIVFLDHVNVSFDENIKAENYYIVYSWGDGIAPFEQLDIRGH